MFTIHERGRPGRAWVAAARGRFRGVRAPRHREPRVVSSELTPRGYARSTGASSWTLSVSVNRDWGPTICAVVVVVLGVQLPPTVCAGAEVFRSPLLSHLAVARFLGSREDAARKCADVDAARKCADVEICAMPTLEEFRGLLTGCYALLASSEANAIASLLPFANEESGCLL